MTGKENRFRRTWAVSLMVIGVLSVIQSANSIVTYINDSGFLPDVLVRVIGVCQMAAAAVLVFAGIRLAKIEKEKGKDRK